MSLELDCIDVASYITKECANKNFFVNLTKIQKLVFCVYGAVLATSGERICKEHPIAFPHGPVFTNIYNLHSEDGIVEALLAHKEKVENKLTSLQKHIIEITIDMFGKYNAGTLVNWTKDLKGPWYQATKGGRVLHIVITDTLIAEYFKTLLEPV